jgi:predicted heme/steroid binding protein
MVMLLSAFTNAVCQRMIQYKLISKSTTSTVAIKGMIYDISGKDSWESGNHFDMHGSGQDLIDAWKARLMVMKYFLIHRQLKL